MDAAIEDTAMIIKHRARSASTTLAVLWVCTTPALAQPSAAPAPSETETPPPAAVTVPSPAPESGSAPVPEAAPQQPPTPPAPPPAPATGPQIELPPETGTAPEQNEAGIHLGVDASDESVMTRGLQPTRMAQEGTVIGGYGEFNLNSLKVGTDNDFTTTASVRRLVLFVSHHMTDAIQVYTEFEWENALACSDCEGAAEVEQAFVDWKLHGDALALRAG